MADFLAMDGFAAFVWPSYILSALGIGGMAIWVWLELRAARRLPGPTPEDKGDG